MIVGITGAFGQIGTALLKKMIEEDFRKGENAIRVICFDVSRKKKIAKRFTKNNDISFFEGDVRVISYVQTFVDQCDVIIHLAYIIPPIIDEQIAEQINIEGTRNILKAIQDANKRLNKSIRLIFPTSVADLGKVPKNKQPISPEYSELNPIDVYGKHKKICLEMIKDTDIKGFIFRLTVCPPLTGITTNITMFDVSPDAWIEVVHEKDVASAFYNAIFLLEQYEEIQYYNIGGGELCQMRYIDFINQKFAKAMGLGTFEEKLFKDIMSTAKLDTTLSQEVLQYQKHSLDDIIYDMKRNNRFLFFAVKLMRPIVRRYLISKSS